MTWSDTVAPVQYVKWYFLWLIVMVTALGIFYIGLDLLF